jgi:hypothetical protein
MSFFCDQVIPLRIITADVELGPDGDKERLIDKFMQETRDPYARRNMYYGKPFHLRSRDKVRMQHGYFKEKRKRIKQATKDVILPDCGDALPPYENIVLFNEDLENIYYAKSRRGQRFRPLANDAF